MTPGRKGTMEEAGGDGLSAEERLAAVEMEEGEDEAPTINVGDPAPEAETGKAGLRAEMGRLRRQAEELLAAIGRLEARLRE